MLNNIGLPGVFLILLIVFLIWLMVRSGKKKAEDRARIAASLEKIAESEKNK